MSSVKKRVNEWISLDDPERLRKRVNEWVGVKKEAEDSTILKNLGRRVRNERKAF